jgi:hypothetical protein
VEAPAFGLETPGERSKVVVGPERVRRWGRLQEPRTLDENVPVIEAAQNILRELQSPYCSRRPLISCLCLQLRRIPQLLQRDADLMEAFWRVHRTRGLNRRSEIGRSPRYTRLQRQQPWVSRTAGNPSTRFPVVRFPTFGGTTKRRADPLQFLGRERFRQTFARNRSLGFNSCCQPLQGCQRILTAAVQLPDQQQQNIQLAHFAESSRDFAKLTAEVSGGVGIQLEERYQLTQSS